MKDSVTKFDFDDAFKALDEIEIPKAPKGIKANREDLHETMKRVDKFELLFEDFYDVNNSEDMNAASEEREAEVAKAKLARIEKIVDLDAETEDDILPSYVGKTIIQCPQCMTLFYKDVEDIVRDEENPDLINIGEVCQHCGNDSGYDIIGKVAEETEEVPADNFAEEETTTEETGNGENDLSVEGETTSEEGEVDELSAEADLDELDLDLEEEPAEEEEEIKEESLNTSELLKKIEDKNDLKTENESEKLTLNEDIEDNLDDALKDHEEYINYLRAMIKQEEEALGKATNEQVKKVIQKRLDAFREDLEAALPDAVKAEAQEEELPDAEEAGMEDATDNDAEDVEETTESLHEGKFGKLEAPSEDLSFLANEFDKALEAAHDLKYDIEIKDGYIISVTSFNIKQVDDIAKECFAKHDLVPVITVVSEFVHDYKLAPQDKAAEPAQESLHNSETQEKAEEQSDLKTENESKNLTLNEAAGNNISDADFNELINSSEFKEPISPEEVENYFENFNQASEEVAEEPSDEADIEISVEGDTEPVSLETADSEKEPLTEGPISWGKKVVKGIKDKLDDTATTIATIAKAYKYTNFYILPYADTTQVARYFQDTDKYDTSRSYKKHSRSFLVTNNGAHAFPEFRFKITDLSKDTADIAKEIKDKVIATKDLIKSLNNTYATSFVDLVGSDKNLIGEEYETSKSKQKVKLAYVDVVGVRTTLPDSAPNMSAKDAKTLMGQNQKLAVWLMTAENGNIVINEDFLKSATDKLNNNTDADDVFEDESFKKNLEQKLAKVKRIAYVSSKEDKQTVEQIVESDITNYKKLRDAGIEASESGTNYYTIGLTDDLTTIAEGAELSLAANQFKALIIEKFEDGSAIMNRSFTGKLPEPEAEHKEEGKPKEDSGDDEADKPVEVSAGEPKTAEERKPYIEKIIEKTDKKFIHVFLSKDNKSYSALSDKGPYAKAETFEKLINNLPKYKFLGNSIDTAIILVDKSATFTKGTEIKGITLKPEDILATCASGASTPVTNLKKVADALGIEFKEEEEDLEVEESFKVSDIDDKSFNEKLTESLKEVYENVKDFTMTNCSLDNNKLIIEGTIAFNSGKTRSTQYIFEAKYNSKNVLVLHGQNKALFEDGKIKISTKTVSETLYAKALKYKYSIQGNLVEGLIKK